MDEERVVAGPKRCIEEEKEEPNNFHVLFVNVKGVRDESGGKKRS